MKRIITEDESKIDAYEPNIMQKVSQGRKNCAKIAQKSRRF